MNLRKLFLENFRGFGKTSFEFSQEQTLILGQNTSGKTSILEAIYLLVTGNSFRAEKTEEMIKFEEEIGRVKGEVSRVGEVSLNQNKFVSGQARVPREEEKIDLEVVLTRGFWLDKRVPKKRFLVNGVCRRLTNFTGGFFGVLFRPEDIDLIIGSPSLRRDYLDEVLSQVDAEYQRSLLSYQKGLRARNKILERGRINLQMREGLPSQLYFWDKLLLKNGELITQRREDYLEFVNDSLALNNLQIDYQKNVISSERLAEWREREILIGKTMVGPQRDDFTISSKFKVQSSKLKPGDSGLKRNLESFGSRGEQRMAVLYLKRCQLEYILAKTGERPVLLLDDIFAELDEHFRKEVRKMITGQQTIITGIDEEGIEIDGEEIIRL